MHLNQIHIFYSDAISGGDEGAGLSILKRCEYEQNPSVNLSAEADLKMVVLFSRQRLENIYQRIGSLEAENRAERANFKELHRVKSRLERAKVSREAQIVQLRSKCDDLQMLKYVIY